MTHRITRNQTMKTPLTVIAATLALMLSATAGSAVQIPIDFVGDWCRDDAASYYVLPSWTEDGHCKNILSIGKYGFYGENKHCEPVKIQVGKDTAPSGTTYTAKVTARCQPDGPVTAGELRTFEFSRYKGNLFMTPKNRTHRRFWRLSCAHDHAASLRFHQTVPAVEGG